MMLKTMLSKDGIVKFTSQPGATTVQCHGAAQLIHRVRKMQTGLWNQAKERLHLFMQNYRYETNSSLSGRFSRQIEEHVTCC